MVCASALAKLLLTSTLTLGGYTAAVAVQPRFAGLSPESFQAVRAVQATTGALTTFCNAFKASCSDVCLNGQSGKTKIVFACVSNGDGTLAFGCTCDGTDSTKKALNQVAEPEPTATTSLTSTLSLTLQTTQTSTSTLVVTKGTTTVRPVVTSTSLKGKASTTVRVTKSATSTPVVKSGTLSLTSVDETYVKYPYTDLYSTIFTTTKTAYSTAGTATFSTLSLDGGSQRRAENYLVASIKRDKVSSTFCDAFQSACSANCDAADSSVSTATCSKASTSNGADNYSLLCSCANGNAPTYHVLQDLSTGDTSSVSVVKTRTRYTTVSKTVTATSTAAATTVNKPTTTTVTQPAPGKTTSTITKFVSTAPTTTIPATTTVNTGSDDGYGGNYIISTYTSTRTQVHYDTLTIAASASTTLNVLAPTGRVRADKSDGNGGTKHGYMVSVNNFWAPTDYSGYGVPYGLVQLPPDGTGVDSYYLADMRTIGQVVTNSRGALGGWHDDASGPCGGSFAFDNPMSTIGDQGYQQMIQPFRLGATAANAVNPDSVFQVPLLPHLITYSQEVVSPVVFQAPTGSSLVWGSQPNCDADSSVAVNTLFFEPFGSSD